jgi:hypothetical protein
MRILGTMHNPAEVDAFVKAVVTGMGAKGGLVRIAVEPNERIASRTPFWNLVIRGIQRRADETKSRLEMVYLDTLTGDKVVQRTVANTALPDVPYREYTKWTRGLYVMDIARTKLMAKTIRRTAPDIVLVGAVHALLIGKLLKIKPKYVGTTEQEVRRYYDQEKKKYSEIRKQRVIRRRMRLRTQHRKL